MIMIVLFVIMIVVHLIFELIFIINSSALCLVRAHEGRLLLITINHNRNDVIK